MDGYRSSETVRGRRRVVLPIAMVILGLLAGIALTVVAMRRVQGSGSTTASGRTTARLVNPDYTPAQPLGPGETTTAPQPDPALLATREATLAAQLAAVEARVATVTVDAGAASGQATRAEAMLIAAGVRRAVDHGTALGYLEEQLRARFGQAQPRAVAVLVQAARAPVTLDDLRQGLDDVGETLATGRGDAHWSDSLDRLFADLVVLRRVGTPSPLPVDRLARARRLLDGGQVEAARAEVARLPATGVVTGWMTAVHRYVVTRQALDAIDNAAIVGQAASPTPVTTVIGSIAPAPSVPAVAVPSVPAAAVPPMATR